MIEITLRFLPRRVLRCLPLPLQMSIMDMMEITFSTPAATQRNAAGLYRVQKALALVATDAAMGGYVARESRGGGGTLYLKRDVHTPVHGVACGRSKK
jgi:hypothetical protein